MTEIDPKEARELGMDRRITRRDFLNGIAIGTATSLVVTSPTRHSASGLRGRVNGTSSKCAHTYGFSYPSAR